MKNKTVMIVTGEASGDIYGAELVKALNEKSKKIDFYGVGSSAMKSAGVEILINAKKLSVMGITEVLSRIPFIIYSIKHIRIAMKKLKPELLILIDFPDFNFNIALIAKKLKIPVLYYVSPQIWAWRKGRIKKIKRLVDQMAVILPFEENIYRKYSIPVTFVGHPLLDNIKCLPNTTINDINNESPIIGLLPGSRDKEISKLLPVMLEAAKVIRCSIPSAKFIVSHAKSVNTKRFNEIIAKHNNSLKATISNQPVQQIIKKCNCMVAASGTVTLEASLYGIPSIIVYKVSALSYLIGKILINVEHIGLVNLILGKRLLPELVQTQASCDNIAKIIIDMLNDKESMDKIKLELARVRKCLGKPGASKRVANIAIKMICSHKNINNN